MSSLVKGVIHNGWVEIVEPFDLPEGTEVVVAVGATNDDEPMTPAEATRDLAAMQRGTLLDIPVEVGADLNTW